MSVTATATIRHRPFPNQGDPTLPESVWYAQGAVVEDASGGFAEVVIVLNAAGNKSGRAWSIELSIPRRSVTSPATAIVNSENLDAIGVGLADPIQKSFATALIGSSNNPEAPETTVEVRDLHPHIFLGAQLATTANAQIRIQIPNGDSNIFGWFAAGYEWAPGALNRGYQFPLGGFIG